MILSGQTIKELGLLEPIEPRTQHAPTGTSYGLSMCGYDVRIDQDIVLVPGRTVLASTFERFKLPLDVCGVVHDKSTWARRGISVQNTVLEPGWCGWLTLELLYSPLVAAEGDDDLAYDWIRSGTPIAQVVFHRVDRITDGYSSGKYQNQERGIVRAR